MKWLNTLTGNFLSYAGVDISGRLGGSVQFFLYDIIKITLLLCFLIFAISYVQSYFPPERSKKIMGRFRGLGANLVAALLGTVTPFCSCSSIPLFMGFTNSGLSLGVAFSFLISSPMVDLASLILLMSIFGSRVALLYVIFGLAVAATGGILIEKMHMEAYVEKFIHAPLCAEADSSVPTQRERLADAIEQTLCTFKDVFPYILAGVATGAIIYNWIPAGVVAEILGSKNPFGVILAVIIGAPIYADIFGTIPVAEALLLKGAKLGTVLSFMMAVTTLSLPSMIMLRKTVKPPLLVLFAAICVVGIIMAGYFFNAIQSLIY